MKFVFYSIIVITITGWTTIYSQNKSQSTNSNEFDEIRQTSVEQSSEFEFELGIRDELDMMFANIYDHTSSVTENTLEHGLIPINFHLTAGINYRNNFKLYLLYGLTNIIEDFQGFDGGIFFRGNFYDQLYGVAGIDFINKMGNSHNLSNSPKEKFTFYCLGAGYKFSNHFTIDLMYYIPDNKVFGYDINPENYTYYNKINNGIIKLGFEYLFIF